MPLGDSYVTTGQTKMSDAEAREHEVELFAKRVTEIPHSLQLRQESSRPDLQPDYVGYGARGLATSVIGWMVYKFTYHANGYVTLRQTGYGKWDDRATITYA